MKTEIFLALCASAVAAEPLKVEKLAIGSREYLKVTIEKETETTARIVHESGVANVGMKDLPDEVRVKIGFNEEAAKVEQAKLDQQNLKQVGIQKRNIRREELMDQMYRDAFGRVIRKTTAVCYMKVDSVEDEGLIGHIEFWKDEPPFGPFGATRTILLETTMTPGKFVDGKGYKINAVKSGVFTYTTVEGAKATVEKWKDIELILDQEIPSSK